MDEQRTNNERTKDEQWTKDNKSKNISKLYIKRCFGRENLFF
ncbi:hypothetical protein ACSQ7D_02490 [Capnocytophaga sp. G1920]